MLYDILKDFKGSQDGRFAKDFKAGTQAILSDYLAGIVVPEGWAKLAEPAADSQSDSEADPTDDPAGDPATLDNKAVVSDGSGAVVRRRRSKSAD